MLQRHQAAEGRVVKTQKIREGEPRTRSTRQKRLLGSLLVSATTPKGTAFPVGRHEEAAARENLTCSSKIRQRGTTSSCPVSTRAYVVTASHQEVAGKRWSHDLIITSKIYTTAPHRQTSARTTKDQRSASRRSQPDQVS